MITPIRKMNEQVDVVKYGSDTDYFSELMFAGEQLFKIIIAALVSGIDDGKANSKNNQYALNYALVHADSIGSWDEVLSNIVNGEAHRFVKKEFEPIIQEL